MAFWIELTCDVRKPNVHTRCYSWENNNVCNVFSNADFWRSRKQLSDEARKAGWRKTRAGWICPACQRK